MLTPLSDDPPTAAAEPSPGTLTKAQKTRLRRKEAKARAELECDHDPVEKKKINMANQILANLGLKELGEEDDSSDGDQFELYNEDRSLNCKRFLKVQRLRLDKVEFVDEVLCCKETAKEVNKFASAKLAEKQRKEQRHKAGEPEKRRNEQRHEAQVLSESFYLVEDDDGSTMWDRDVRSESELSCEDDEDA